MRHTVKHIDANSLNLEKLDCMDLNMSYEWLVYINFSYNKLIQIFLYAIQINV